VTVDHEAYGAAWRQRDYDVMNSPEFKKALADNHVIVVKWKDLGKLLRTSERNDETDRRVADGNAARPASR
jgi:hypothetical protein